MNSQFYGWKLLGVFWAIYLINLSFPAYGSSVMNAYMAEDLHLNRKMLGTTFSLFQLMIGLAGPLIAYCIGKMGVRGTLTLGSLLVLAGSIAMAGLVRTDWQAVVVFGLIVGFGSGAGGSMTAQVGIGNWFIKRRAVASSTMYTGAGIGGFIAAPLLNRVIDSASGNWRVGWWMVAALAAVSATVSALFVRERPADLGQLPDGGCEDANAPGFPDKGYAARLLVYRTAEDWTFGESLRTPAFWGLTIASSLISIGFVMFMAHGVVHLKGLGHSPATAAMAMSVMALSLLLGKLAAGMGDAIEPRYIWALAMALFGAGLVLAVNAMSTVQLFPFAVLLGAGWGAALVCIMTVPINYFGRKAFPSIIGLMLAVQVAVGSAAPIIAGYLYDEHKSYAIPFYAAALLCLVGGLLLLGIRPPVRQQTFSSDRAGKILAPVA